MLEGMKILLAEDNATNQLVAVQMLETLGASVRVASDGVEALELLELETFDLLLVDIEMPRISGLDVIRRVREGNSRLAHTPAIALTAYVMREHQRQITAAGADGVIPKPIMSVERFGRELLSFVEEARGRRESTEIEREAKADIDPAALEQLGAALGEEAAQAVVSKAISDITETGTRLCEAIAASDVDEIHRSSHIIAGLAGVVGANHLEGLARTIEAGLQQDALPEGETLAELENSLAKTIEALHAYPQAPDLAASLSR